MPDSRSDATLVDQVQAGDREAFERLIKRYQRMVFELTTQYAAVSSDADDLAQDVFLRAFQHINRIDTPGRFASWLYGIALNRCRDYAKNRRRDTYAFTDQETEAGRLPARNQTESDTALMQSEESERMWKAIQALSPTYAVPFLLKYRDGLTYQAMSERMDVSVSALKVRVHRARKKLQTHLGRTDDE